MHVAYCKFAALSCVTDACDNARPAVLVRVHTEM